MDQATSSFLEDKTSEEGLLWVIQEGDTVITFFMKILEDKDQPGAIGEIISAPSGMHLYIYYLYLCHKGNSKRKEPLLKSWI